MSISKDLNDWHAANKAAQTMPVKFNVYIEELIISRRINPTARCRHQQHLRRL